MGAERTLNPRFCDGRPSGNRCSVFSSQVPVTRPETFLPPGTGLRAASPESAWTPEELEAELAPGQAALGALDTTPRTRRQRRWRGRPPTARPKRSGCSTAWSISPCRGRRKSRRSSWCGSGRRTSGRTTCPICCIAARSGCKRLRSYALISTCAAESGRNEI